MVFARFLNGSGTLMVYQLSFTFFVFFLFSAGYDRGQASASANDARIISFVGLWTYVGFSKVNRGVTSAINYCNVRSTTRKIRLSRIRVVPNLGMIYNKMRPTIMRPLVRSGGQTFRVPRVKGKVFYRCARAMKDGRFQGAIVSFQVGVM